MPRQAMTNRMHMLIKQSLLAPEGRNITSPLRKQWVFEIFTPFQSPSGATPSVHIRICVAPLGLWFSNIYIYPQLALWATYVTPLRGG